MSTAPLASSSFTPLHRDNVEVHEGAGGAMLYDPLTANTLRLNSTALEIWKQCDGSHKAADIASRLAALFEISLGESQKHVERMIQELHSLNLLVAEEAAINDLFFEST